MFSPRKYYHKRQNNNNNNNNDYYYYKFYYSVIGSKYIQINKCVRRSFRVNLIRSYAILAPITDHITTADAHIDT